MLIQVVNCYCEQLTSFFCKTDVGNEQDIKNAVNLAVEQKGRVDVLVNNAAMMTFKKIVDLSSVWPKHMAELLAEAL